MELVTTSSALPLPAPKVDIHIRPATVDDIPFMDALQKKTTKQVGWMPTKQFEGKIAAGHVLVGCVSDAPCTGGASASEASPPSETHPTRVAYLIGNDQYFKRDDVGIIYQINVVEEYRRSFVAANLLKAQFERSAYGCKLYCCWCAQDIEANRFWESMGFVPIAYRAGSESKGPKGTPRVHIFWQKRIRAGDDSTPWWYPAKTDGGAIREDRVILPIPPGMTWRDELPLLLNDAAEAPKAKSMRKKKVVPEPVKPVRRMVVFGPPGAPLPMVESPAPVLPAPIETLPEKPKKTKRKADPAVVSKARELRDRWLEQVNASPVMVEGKYDVGRAIESTSIEVTKLIAA